VVQYPANVTVDYTSPKGTITRETYDQNVPVIAGAEKTEAQGFSRSFRCMQSDLPTVPLTSLKVLYEDHTYSVVKHSRGASSVVLLHTTRK